MKNIILVLFVLSWTMGTSAQVGSKSAGFAYIKEEEKLMSQGERNALVMEIAAKDGLVEDQWKDFLNSFKAKPKWMKKEKEWFSDNAIIEEIGGNNPIDIYATIEGSKGDITTISVWFDLGGAFLSSYQHAEKYKQAQKFMSKFNNEVQIALVKKEIEKEEKKLKKEESNLKDLIKDNENLHKDIENYKEKIKKAEADIIKNDKDQKDTQKNIEDQRGVVKKVQSKLEQLEKS